MTSITETARQFMDACETGKGWQACRQFCEPDATFAAQADALAGVESLESYTEWMKGMFTPLPDGAYDLTAIAADEEGRSVTAVAVFRATHTGDGGPVPPTGKRVESDYVYHMRFEGDRISHVTKVWNDAVCLRQLGWT